MPLMQPTGGVFSPLADPEPLPAPPFIERYFLQDATLTAVFLVIVGLIIWWLLRRAGKPRWSWPALGAGITLGGLSLLLAQYVTTEREALVHRSRELIENVIAARADSVEPVLRSDLTVALLSRQTRIDKARIIALIREDAPRTRYSMSQADLRWCTATLDSPTVARTQCRVQVNAPWGWTPTVWMIHWTRQSKDDPWRVRAIEGQQIGLMPQGSIGDL